MQTRRTERVSDLLLHEIAQILQRDVKDPRIGFVTLTAVQISADLRVAKVLYTVLGEQPNREACLQGLQSATPFIRREVGRRLRLRVVPELRFAFDDTMERTLHLQEMLEDLSHAPKESDR